MGGLESIMIKKSITAIISATFISACSPADTTKTTKSIDKSSQLTGSPATDLDYAYSPQQQLAGFTVPEGFRVDLVASEEGGVINPIDIAFDDAGRLWVQTASMYPMDAVGDDVSFVEVLEIMRDPSKQAGGRYKTILDYYQGVTPGDDKILVISDPYADKPSKPTVWAEGLAMPQSILPYKSGAIVAQGSEMFFLDDTDGDGKSDRRETLLTGFGITDSHTLPHTLVRAPGGWVHFSQGALNSGRVKSKVSDAELDVNYSKIVRMSLDARRIELAGSGLQNIWGFQLRGNGQWYGTEANDMGWSVVPMEVGTGYKGIGNERIRPYQPWLPAPHKFRVGGTGISGLAFADDLAGSFPKKWKDIAFLANPITSKINAVKVYRNPDGTIVGEHLPDFLTSKDPRFRPVNMEFGPDGCLYVVDWYNKIISHNEVERDHPDRDRSHGRIWRVCHDSQPEPEVPNLYLAANKDLPGHLLAPSIWQKRAAWHQIVDRNATELAGPLKTMIADTSLDITTRIHALWSLEGIAHYDETLMSNLLASSDDELRREAVRALASFAISPAQVAKHLTPLRDDNNVMVRSQLLRTLREVGQANKDTIDLLVYFSKDDIPGETLGGAYERKFERFLARMALEEYQDQLAEYLTSEQANNQPANNLLWATQAFDDASVREKWFLALWPKLGDEYLDNANFIIIGSMLGNNSAIANLIRPSFNNTDNAQKLVKFAQQNYTKIQSPKMSELLRPALVELLKSEDKATLALAVDVANKFSVNGVAEEVAQIIHYQHADESLLRAVVSLLADDTQAVKPQLVSLLERDDLSLGLRIHTLKQLINSDTKFVQTWLTAKVPHMNNTEKRAVVSSFRGNKHGARVLLNLLEKGVLNYQNFDAHSAQFITQFQPDDARSAELAAVMTKLEKEEREGMQARIEHLVALAEKRGGNPQNGKALFTGLCLSCHIVGSEGAGFAPALDGSGHRDNEGLLTAIVNPDAAIESGYTLYRILKKDGSIIEGYRQWHNRRGTRLRFMGGGEVFIPVADIEQQYFVKGRSVMPKGLIDYLGDSQIEDLLAYIRSLK